MYMPTGSTDQEDLESNSSVDGDWRIDPYPQGNVIGFIKSGRKQDKSRYKGYSRWVLLLFIHKRTRGLAVG